MLDARCPRCGGRFECGAASGPAGRCDCFGIRLGDRLRERLAREHPGQCLCLPCLRQLIEADKREPAQPAG